MSRLAACLLALLSLGGQAFGGFQYFKVIDNGNNNASPRIDGDFIVWTNLVTLGLSQSTNDVEGFDLSQQRHFIVARTAADDNHGGISESIVVWTTAGLGGALYARDLRTGTDIEMPYAIQREYISPRISHGQVIWQEPNNLPVRVLARKLSEPVTNVTPISPPLTTDFERFAYNDIAGTTAVWSDNPSNSFNGTRLYWRDLRSTTVRRVSLRDSYQRSPSTSERFILWEDFQNGLAQVYVRDILLDIEYPIQPTSNTNFAQSMPAIDGSFAVWVFNHDNKSDIYGRDLLSGAPAFLISPDDGKFRWKPDVSGNRVVWNELHTDGANGIYGAIIPEPTSLVTVALASCVAMACRRRKFSRVGL